MTIRRADHLRPYYQADFAEKGKVIEAVRAERVYGEPFRERLLFQLRDMTPEELSASAVEGV